MWSSIYLVLAFISALQINMTKCFPAVLFPSRLDELTVWQTPQEDHLRRALSQFLYAQNFSYGCNTQAIGYI